MHDRTVTLQTLWSVSLFILFTFAPASVRVVSADNGDCGIPHTFGPKSRVSDCLFILKAGVQLVDCDPCVCDTNSSGDTSASDAQLCLRSAVGQRVALACPPCVPAGGCPASVAWSNEARTGIPCGDNADCSGAVCDLVTDRCTSVTSLDIGWTGLAHGADLVHASTLKLTVDCEAADAPCGACEVTGVDPSAGSCRCSNDNRRTCDEAFEQDEDDCPACENGAFVGEACATNADCTAGTCTRRCSNDLSPCENSGDCPDGTCEAQSQCSNGRSCSLESECVGTCTQSAQCRCYDGPPLAVTARDAAICVVQRLTGEPTGTVNVDTGESSITEPLQLLVHFSSSEAAPCPVCGGTCDHDPGITCFFDSDCGAGNECGLDPVVGDDERGGVCIGGANDGEPCDVDALNLTLPAGLEGDAGGGTSLDCMPSTGSVAAGPGQSLDVTFSTATDTLSSGLSCGGDNDELSCPCLVCSSNPAVACSSNADCAGEAGSCSLSAEITCDTNADCTGVNGGVCLGTDRCSDAPTVPCNNDGDCESVNVGSCQPSRCDADGDAGFPQPNQCSDGICSTLTDECASGPDDLFCDDFVSGDGNPIAPCALNTDCLTEGSTCTVGKRRRCFAGALSAEGSAHPRHPALASAFCLAPTPSDTINEAFGLPGPVRWMRQATQRSFCESAPGKLYRAGTGNCPE